MSIKQNTASLRSLLDAVNALPEAGSGGSEPVLQDKTITPTVTAQTVTADDGYDGLSSVIVNAMPTATQATPSISVNNSSGLITASSTQTAGYVSAGTKSATKQLTTQAAQTITPGTSDKTITSGRYLTGTQTIKGDANLVPENIKSGVSIFGVEGTMEAGSGDGAGGLSVDEFLGRDLEGLYVNKTVSYLGPYALAGCGGLTYVDLHMVCSIEYGAFTGCDELKAIVLRFTDNVCNADTADIGVNDKTILVPRDLIEAYETDVCWGVYSVHFRALEDYTVDGTVTGEIDCSLLDEEFANQYQMYGWDTSTENHEWIEIGTISGEPGMPWYVWLNSGYNNSGIFMLSDDEGYILYGNRSPDNRYYVTDPNRTPITPDYPIDAFDGAIFLTHVNDIASE